jgi:DNA-binding protein YbaB
MFEQLKNLKKAQEMQKAFSEEKHTVEEDGVKVTVNGNFKIEEIIIEDSVERPELGFKIQKITNRALEEIQQVLARKILSQ